MYFDGVLPVAPALGAVKVLAGCGGEWREHHGIPVAAAGTLGPGMVFAVALRRCWRSMGHGSERLRPGLVLGYSHGPIDVRQWHESCGRERNV